MFAEVPAGTGYQAQLPEPESPQAAAALPDHVSQQPDRIAKRFVKLPDHLSAAPLSQRSGPFLSLPSWKDPERYRKLRLMLPPSSTASSKGGLTFAVWKGMLARAEWEESYLRSAGHPDRAQHWHLCLMQAIAEHDDDKHHRNHLFWEAKRARLCKEEEALGQRLSADNDMRDCMRSWLEPAAPPGPAPAPPLLPASHQAETAAPASSHTVRPGSDVTLVLDDDDDVFSVSSQEPNPNSGGQDGVAFTCAHVFECLAVLASLGDSCWVQVGELSHHMGREPRDVLELTKILEASHRVQRAFGHVRQISDATQAQPPLSNESPYDLYCLIDYLAAPSKPWVPAGVIECVARSFCGWSSLSFDSAIHHLTRTAQMLQRGAFVRVAGRAYDRGLASAITDSMTSHSVE